MKVVILGSGLAGLSAMYHSRNQDYLLLERENQVGGLCSSKEVNGYIFDNAPHIFYTKNNYIKNLIFKLLKGNLIEQKRRAYIFLKNVFVKYPFEANLKPLPDEIIEECIKGVIERKKSKPKNFKEWIYCTFGRGIAKYYMIPYNEKLWKYKLEKMSLAWIVGRVPSPSVEDMRRGASKKQKKEFGGNVKFFYPKKHGIGAIANSFLPISNFSLKSEVTQIKCNHNEIEINYEKHGRIKNVKSKYVISSLPLPDLTKMILDAPERVIKAAKKLVYNSLVCINLGVKRSRISDKHWVYFPEKNFVFNRISFPMNFSKLTTPKNRSSILVEVTHRKNKELNVNVIKHSVIEGLITAKILKENDKLEVCDIRCFKYAYVIYDLNHKKNVRIIHDYLRKNNIIPIGRYGEWEYINMDKSILSGRRGVKEVIERLR